MKLMLLAWMVVGTTSSVGLAQEGNASAQSSSQGADVDRQALVDEIERALSQVEGWGAAVGSEGKASEQDQNCVGGAAALLDELAVSAKGAAARMSEAEAEGNQAAAQREGRALERAVEEARDVATAAQQCAQAAGVVGDDGQLLVRGGTGDPESDTKKPEIDPLSMASDPSRVSPF